MTLKKAGGYHLNDDEQPQSLFLKDAADTRLDRMGRWLMFLMVICMLLLGFAAYLGYREVFSGPEGARPRTAEETDQRMDNLESSFSNLSIRQARLEEALNRQGEDLLTQLVNLELNLKMIEAGHYELGASKVDRKELAEAFDPFKQQLESIASALEQRQVHQQSLETDVQAQIAALAEQVADTQAATQGVVKDFTAAMEHITTSLTEIRQVRDRVREFQTELGRTRSVVTELRADLLIQTETKADKSLMEASLKTLDQRLQERSAQMRQELEKRLRDIQSQVDELIMQ